MITTKQAVVAVLAVLALIGSGIALYRGSRPASSLIKSDVLQSCGEVAGEETLRLLGGTGRVVVLRLTTGQSIDRMKSIQALRLKGLERGLASSGQVEILAVRDVVVGSNSFETDITFPTSQYREMIEAYPEADAIICLAGNPFSASPALVGWPARRPKCVLLEIIPQGVPELVARGVVDVAFVLCQSSSPAAGPPETPREWFDRMYEVVTRNNYTELAE